MKRILLRAVSLSALCGVVFAANGCGNTKITPGGPRDFAPQTGSMIGRRLPVGSTQMVDRTPKSAAKPKRTKAVKEQKRERAADDYMTRGGFR
ncbi:MAG: hypothetical protein M3Y69_10435 [Verrucomicrobiota bacterium]|nr:hypothetical protein [Verrucomicrobiota bacterium]